MITTELLAPAKDYASAVDAVDCGADAVYIGGSKFGARYAAANSVDDIARTVDYARKFGARVYATLNTLLFDDEIDEARALAERIVAAGVDALIVQDTAYCRMGLNVELHASTQMCNMSPEQAKFLADCGFARVILERALSLDGIRAVRSATDVELEAFVHGAICVGHSGRCFLSRSMGERSGNRGACSQPCRLTYDLTDGRGNAIIRGKHLLSLRDLSLADRLGDLLDAGVTSFKIEGRLKERDYVRNVVSCYRRALDDAMAVRGGFVRSSSGRSTVDFTPDPNKSFTRGGSEYFIDGKRAGVASFDTPKAVGEYLGEVTSLRGRGFTMNGTLPAAGDGICFVTPQGVVGTNINGCDGGVVVPNRMEGITVGAAVCRNYDRLFAKAVGNGRIRRAVEVRARVAVVPDCLSMRFEDADGASVEVRRNGEFAAASDVERMAEIIRTQTAKSGDTMFDVVSVDVDNGGGLFIPSSMLNALRREGLEALEQKRISLPRKHRIFNENLAAKYCKASLSPQDNVTNALAERFYRDHGVEHIEYGLDLRQSTVGECVMRTSYCIRREIGQCLREHPSLRGDLYLERGRHRYLLRFDCDKCEMTLTDKTEQII